MKYILVSLSLFFFFLTSLIAQDALPQTKVYQFDITQQGKRLSTSNAKLLTGDNSGGYNNQPAFINDKLYITQSSILNGKEQTDIVALDVYQKTKSKVTLTTKWNEYSPSLHPDGEHFCVIRQYPDGRQHLVKYRLDQKGKGEILFSRTSDIAYYCWLDNNTVALVRLGNKSTGTKLVIGDVEKASMKHIAFKVGRCLKKAPSGNLVYVTQEGGKWLLKTIKPATNQTNILGEVLPKEEDFEILADGSVIAGHNTSIYRLAPEKGGEWVFMGGLEKYLGEGQFISRIVVKDGKLAIVTSDEQF